MSNQYRNPWTKQEIRILYDWVKPGVKIRDLELKLPRRTYEAIKTKLKVLGIKKGDVKGINKKDITDRIVEIAEKAFGSSPAVKKPVIFKIKKGKHQEEIALLKFSDSHVGKKTVTYNPRVFIERLENLKKAIMKIITPLRTIREIKKLVIVFEGDIIDAESIYPGQAVDGISETILTQIFGTTVPELHNFLLFCLDNFEEVECHCVKGNHGKLNAAKWSSSKSTNWDLVVYKVLEAVTKNQDRLKWNIIENDWKVIFKIFNHGFLACHGDMIKSYMNLPFYGMIRQATRWQSAYSSKIWIEHFLFAHFHSAVAGIRFNQVNIYVNGPFVTDDEFAEEKLGVTSVPEQVLLGVHPKYGVTWRYILRL